MKRIFFILLGIWIPLFSNPASASSDKIIVAKVKGDVKVKKNQKATPGLILHVTDYLEFSSLDQAVVCLHPEFGKMVFKPFSKLQVNSRIPITDLLIPYQGQRGMNRSGEVQHFQTLKDSLRLSLQTDLKIRQVEKGSDFQLLDQRMKKAARKPRADSVSVWTFADKKATYFLHYSQAAGNSKTVAEIEFMEPAEIRNELKYMAQLVTAPEAKAKKEEYLARQYKSLSEEDRKVLLAE